MARSRSQRARDKAEYRRNRDLLLAGQPRHCMLCHGAEGPLLYEEDLAHVRERWWLHPLAATADHIIPVHEGGSNALANLRPAHRGCNSKRNRSVSFDELPRRLRDFGRPATTVYGQAGRAAPRSF